MYSLDFKTRALSCLHFNCHTTFVNYDTVDQSLKGGFLEEGRDAKRGKTTVTMGIQYLEGHQDRKGATTAVVAAYPCPVA